ncbi:hypothetical protein [Hymenobacter sp. AT01-02]|uniref:hypothetical protein n=1 Tax=Hymenobacter sp. AT01-02 TaxID=1571877 RepID=UPI0006E3D720|nr:hypothetical protein [Hymenobacter sp. AT01-02]
MAASLVVAEGKRLPLAADSRVALTVQANDLLKADSVQSDYTNTLTLADTPEVRAALDQAQQGMSLSEVPYQQLPCTLETGATEVLPNGVAIVEQHETGKGFEAQVLGGNKNFYAAIEGKKLRELTFPAAMEHDWLLPYAASGATHEHYRQGYVYDLYDLGKGVLDVVNLHTDGILPSVYARAVWEQIITEAGFKWSGNLPVLFDRLLLPTPTAPGYSKEFRAARKLVAGIDHAGGKNTDSGRAYEGRPEVQRVVPFDYTGGNYGYVAPTQAGVWNPTAHSWKALEPCYVQVNGSVTLELSSPYGSAKAQLFTYVNGKEIGGGPAVESKKGADSTYVTATTNAAKLLLRAGDEVTLKIKLNRAKEGIYGTNKWGYTMFDGNIHSINGTTLPLDSFSVDVLADFPPGGRVRLQDLLPDMSQRDFVKGFVGLFGLTQQTDPYTRRLTFTPTAAALAANLGSAPDWSPKVDTQRPAPRLFHLPDQAQQNWFRWKEDSTNPDSAKELGDGMLPCADATLEAKRDTVVLPWAATTQGAQGLLLLPVYKVRVGTVMEAAEYDQQRPAPRLVVQTTQTRAVTLTDGSNTVPIAPRISTFAGLDFQRELLPTYYTHLAAVYARPLLYKPSVRLSALEVTGFDQLQPVWLEKEGAFFYANKLNSWEEDQPSTATELLRLTY